MSQKLGLVPSDEVQKTLSAATLVGAKICHKGEIVLNRLKAHLGVFAVAKQTGAVSLITPCSDFFRM
jgi:type I restriction enzyme S subunit